MILKSVAESFQLQLLFFSMFALLEHVWWIPTDLSSGGWGMEPFDFLNETKGDRTRGGASWPYLSFVLIRFQIHLQLIQLKDIKGL